MKLIVALGVKISSSFLRGCPRHEYPLLLRYAGNWWLVCVLRLSPSTSQHKTFFSLSLPLSTGPARSTLQDLVGQTRKLGICHWSCFFGQLLWIVSERSLWELGYVLSCYVMTSLQHELNHEKYEQGNHKTRGALVLELIRVGIPCRVGAVLNPPLRALVRNTIFNWISLVPSSSLLSSWIRQDHIVSMSSLEVKAVTSPAETGKGLNSLYSC